MERIELLMEQQSKREMELIRSLSEYHETVPLELLKSEQFTC